MLAVPFQKAYLNNILFHRRGVSSQLNSFSINISLLKKAADFPSAKDSCGSGEGMVWESMVALRVVNEGDGKFRPAEVGRSLSWTSSALQILHSCHCHFISVF